MADFAAALKARFEAAGAVAGAVGQRIYWNIVPQNAARPYVRLQVISDPHLQHLKGDEGARDTRVQCDCVAETHSAAHAIAEALIEATRLPETVGGVKFGRRTVEGPRDLGEDVPGKFIHRANLDLIIRHSV